MTSAGRVVRRRRRRLHRALQRRRELTLTCGRGQQSATGSTVVERTDDEAERSRSEAHGSQCQQARMGVTVTAAV